MPALFWIWMAAMLVFLIFEMLSPTFIFFAFAVGALASGIYAAVSPQAYYWQIGIFVVVSVVMLPFTRMLARRITHEPPELSNVDRMIGKVGVVTQDIDPDTGGKIRFEGEIWQAQADRPIAAQVRVRILSVSGTRVQVEPLSETKGESS